MAYPNPSLWGSGGSYMYGGKDYPLFCDWLVLFCQPVNQVKFWSLEYDDLISVFGEVFDHR